MSRRIDVELTSDRGDGTWSWRAAGARQPKGVLDAGLLYAGARPGDVVRAEADFDIDGITVIGVQPPKGARQEPARIEVVGAERDFSPVTSSLTARARHRAERGEDDRPRPRRDDRGPRSGAPGGRPGGPPREGRGARPGGDRSDRPARPPRPAPPAPRPKAKKLRPARIHRDALLAALSPEQQPIAEQLLRGGMPAVRAALQEQNAKAKAEDGLEIPVDTVLGIAEQLVTRARVADWLDRAEAAKATGEELALRDLRSVVSSADDVARDEATRELAVELRTMLEQRTDAEQTGWLADIEGSLSGGRVVRALRLSSRPPEPGTSFPAELTSRLTEAANGALTAEIAPDRWATVHDAVAYSPVRRAVVPAGIPAEPGEELLAAVRKHAGRTPAIASLFGIEPPPDRSKRPTKAAGRNPNLSRAGGPRNATVPVPGRPGGPPVPSARRIPPPPGRQIGATLPGSAPATPPPSAPQRAVGDPTAPLAPPSATGVHEPVESVGTPEAAPATLEPSTGSAGPEVETPAEPGAAATDPGAAMATDAAPSPPDGPAPDVARTDEASGAAASSEDATGAESPSAGTAPAVPGADPSRAATATDPLMAAATEVGPAVAAPDTGATPDSGPLSVTTAAAPGEAPAKDEPASGPADDELPVQATDTDLGGATASEVGSSDAAPAQQGPSASRAGVPADQVAIDPLGAAASEADPAAAAPDERAATGPSDASAVAARVAAASEPQGGPATVESTTMPADRSSTEPLGAPTIEPDVAPSAPADSALPDDAPTGETGAATTDATGAAGPASPDAAAGELDAIVSQAGEGPFEPPAEPPVEGAPNSGVGTVAAEREGSGQSDEDR